MRIRSRVSFPKSLIFNWLAVAVCLSGAALAAHAADVTAPRVIRTFTHHQVTALPRGVSAFRPVVSASGNRILFGLGAGDGHPPGLAVEDFDGANFVFLDEANPVGPGTLSADGTRIVYVVNYNEIRIISGDARDRRTLVTSTNGGITTVRITADGKRVFFLAARGFELHDAVNTRSFIRGIYRINADGQDLRRVAGPEEVGRVQGARADDVGYPNFCTGYDAGSMDVSFDGRSIAFGCYDKVGGFLAGCDGDGGKLHVISERRNPPDGKTTQAFLSIAVSGDGTTVACQMIYPNEIIVSGFDGKGEKSLLKENHEDQPIGWGSSEPIYITADGSRVTYAGRHIYSDGSGWFQLLKTHQDNLLRYSEYEIPAPDAIGRRFAYWSHDDGPMQLATMELNVRPATCAALLVCPKSPWIPRPSHTKRRTYPRRKRPPVQPPPRCPTIFPAAVSENGLYNTGLTQNGRVGITDLLDDGKVEADGDARARDGIYTGRWLWAYPETPAGTLWTLRFEAQVQDDAKRYHGQVVEIGPFAVVDGQPTGGPVVIDGTAPPPPAVNTKIGSSSGIDPLNPGNPKPGSGSIDLTGYWLSESGARSLRPADR